MAYDPSKVKPTPPPYRPADDTPKYDDDNPPTWKDFVKAANKARKSLKDLKP